MKGHFKLVTFRGFIYRLISIYTESASGRHGFLSYILSLMRSYNDEHAGCLPSLDVMALKHVAYIFDAMIYYMKASTEDIDADIMINNDRISIQSWPEAEDEDSKVLISPWL